MASALAEAAGLVLETIVSKSGARAAAALSCCSSRLRSAVGLADTAWRSFCVDDFALSADDAPVDPYGRPCASFKDAYYIWAASFSMYPLPLVKRVAQFWRSMKAWLAANFPEVLETLNKGASEAQLTAAEESLGFQLPVPAKVIYRFCNGQLPFSENYSHNACLAPFGLIGGYEFYDHAVNVHLSPIEQVVKETKELYGVPGISSKSKLILVALSWFSPKYFFLNCSDGQLYVGTKNFELDGQMMACVPKSLIRPTCQEEHNAPQDGLLLWLEEHLRRLQSNMVGTRIINKVRTLSLYPELPPLCSSAITNGVKVRASAVFVPEFSDPDDVNEKYFYTYSIRMSLVPSGCVVDGMHYPSCQLYSRDWRFRSGDILVSELQAAPGVIGKYPILLPGKAEFIYESCSPLPDAPGSVEGSFTFFPGRLSRPEGSPFSVEVARFVLEKPEYVF